MYQHLAPGALFSMQDRVVFMTGGAGGIASGLAKGENGAADGLKPGSVVIDMTTIDPQTSKPGAHRRGAAAPGARRRHGRCDLGRNPAGGRRGAQPFRPGAMTDADAIRLTPEDNVATVLRAVRPGERLQVRCGGVVSDVLARDAIPLCHKISLARIADGQHVHVHNMRSARAKGPAP